ncbi:hypothetical protein TNCV_4820631 [Trichonephila clavipes]|nr:hypothetical protein TNCV_4820631 [Trichonephila clavipes]
MLKSRSHPLTVVQNDSSCCYVRLNQIKLRSQRNIDLVRPSQNYIQPSGWKRNEREREREREKSILIDVAKRKVLKDIKIDPKLSAVKLAAETSRIMGRSVSAETEKCD